MRQFCSKSCAAKFNNSREDIKKKISVAVSKSLIHKICEWCNIEYFIRSSGKHSQNRKFCSCNCAAKYRMSSLKRKETSKKYGYIMSQKNIGKKRPDVSKRMKENNPMSNSATIEKMKKSKSGQTFLSRGGNPKKTIPQIMLANALNLTEMMEYQINTNDLKDKFKNLPHWYKVDIAIPDKKISIEVDGNTHKTKRWKQIDKRKTKVLESLGWKVIRFWNEEILNDLENVLKKIYNEMS